MKEAVDLLFEWTAAWPQNQPKGITTTSMLRQLARTAGTCRNGVGGPSTKIFTRSHGELVFVLSNGAAGAEKQAIALARGWGKPYRTLRVLPHPLLARAPTSAQLLVARTVGVSGALFDRRSPDVDALFGSPLPAFAVSCGRASILASVCLRTLGKGLLRTVHIQHPRCSFENFDHVVLPSHDIHGRATGADGWGWASGPAGVGLQRTQTGLITSIGSLHSIDAGALAAARESEEARALECAPRPHIVLLLGGPTAAAPYSPEDAQCVLRAAHSVACRAGGSLLVSTSRRSPPALVHAVNELASADSLVRAWGVADEGKGVPNPYLAFLACADHLIVTADSVNMATEACAAAHHTGARVHIALAEACAGPRLLQLRARGASARLRFFLDMLLHGGAVEPFEPQAFEASVKADRSACGQALRCAIASQTAKIARAVFGGKHLPPFAESRA